MATIINTPASTRESGGSNFLLGVILFLILAVLFFVYGIPYISHSVSNPQVNVPGKIDVNVNTPQK